MSRYERKYLDVIPPALTESADAVAALAGEAPRVFQPMPTQRSWVGSTSRCFVYLASDPVGRGRIRLERARSTWAREHGIPTPQVVAAAEDGSWLVVERVPDDPPEGELYVKGALAAALAFAEAPAPPARLLQGSTSRRPARRTLPVRLARMLRWGVDLREFSAVRRGALRLPSDTTSHRDFTVGNVLFDAANGRVHVMDLEFMGLAPRGMDALTLWCGLDVREDRDAVVDALLTGAGRRERARLALLHRWLALRTLADRAIAPHWLREPHRIRESARLVDEARRNAIDWTR